MTRKSRRQLSDHEKVLWHKVERTVTPLPGRQPLFDPDAALPAAEAKAAPEKEVSGAIRSASADIRHQPPPPQKQPVRPHIDRPTSRKIAKGRIAIDARIDLHDMTQALAHDRLYAFLADARSRGLRHVLVVTGKGRSLGSEGVLKRMVPVWLNGPRFSEIVSGYSTAGQRHGGEGAIYVRLRKLARTDGSYRR
jgi:DNA-nicking Smr family endonuclease